MLYTIVILLSGIYFGQEVQLPSVKEYITMLIVYINSLKKTIDDQHPTPTQTMNDNTQNENPNTILNNIYEYMTNLKWSLF
jgi:hypothetical protein